MIEIPMTYFNKRDSIWLEDFQQQIKRSIKNRESEFLLILDEESLVTFDWYPVLLYINSIDQEVIAIGGISSQKCIPINDSV